MRNTIFALFFAFLFISCEDTPTDSFSDLNELPVVLDTQTTYHEADIRARVPNRELFDRFNEAYRDSYSDRLKLRLVDYIIYKARRLGLDTDVLRLCLLATGRLDSGVVALPYLAEHAGYEADESWILEFVRGYPPSTLGHYCCYVIDVADQDTLLFITCR